MSDKKKPIRILRVGKFTPTKGAAVEFTEAMLQEIASSYNPSKHQAPIVIGHPKDNAPAFGWIKSLSVADGFLQAEPDQVDPAFAELVNEGKFKHVSASFYGPTSPNNPEPGKMSLRHLGFLGAQPPAVKGLGAYNFAEDEADTVTVDFEDKYANGWDLQRVAAMLRGIKNFIIGEKGQEVADQVMPEWQLEGIAASGARKDALGDTPSFTEPQPEPQPTVKPDQATVDLAERTASLDAREQDLQQRQAALDARDRKLREDGYAEFAEALIGQGRLVPAQKASVLTILQELDGGSEVSFGEGDNAPKMTAVDGFKKLLETLPKRVDFTERAPLTGDVVDLSDPEAVGLAASRLIDAEAAKGITITATEAVSRIKQGA